MFSGAVHGVSKWHRPLLKLCTQRINTLSALDGAATDLSAQHLHARGASAGLPPVAEDLYTRQLNKELETLALAEKLYAEHSLTMGDLKRVRSHAPPPEPQCTRRNHTPHRAAARAPARLRNTKGIQPPRAFTGPLARPSWWGASPSLALMT